VSRLGERLIQAARVGSPSLGASSIPRPIGCITMMMSTAPEKASFGGWQAGVGPSLRGEALRARKPSSGRRREVALRLVQAAAFVQKMHLDDQ
jgi:hypothetical protein